MKVCPATLLCFTYGVVDVRHCCFAGHLCIRKCVDFGWQETSVYNTSTKMNLRD